MFLKRNTFWYTVQSITSKIIKIVATSCHILRLKCTKFGFGCGSTPDPAGHGQRLKYSGFLLETLVFFVSCDFTFIRPWLYKTEQEPGRIPASRLK